MYNCRPWKKHGLTVSPLLLCNNILPKIHYFTKIGPRTLGAMMMKKNNYTT